MCKKIYCFILVLTVGLCTANAGQSATANIGEVILDEFENTWATSNDYGYANPQHNMSEYRIGYNAAATPAYAIRTLINFDISSLLIDMNSITKVEYRIHYPVATTPGNYQLYKIGAWDWYAGNTTYANTTAWIASGQLLCNFTSTTPARNSSDYIVVDLTKVVLDSLRAGTTNIYFCLVDTVADYVVNPEDFGSVPTYTVLKSSYSGTAPRSQMAIMYKAQNYYETENAWIVKHTNIAAQADTTPAAGGWRNKVDYRLGRQYTGDSPIFRILTKFDFGTLSQAQLDSISNIQYWISPGANPNGNYSIYQLSPWNASTVTYNNVFATYSPAEISGSNFNAKQAGLKRVDITQFVKSKLALGQSAFDFMLVDHTSDMEGLGNTGVTYVIAQSGKSSQAVKARISILYKEAKNYFVITGGEEINVSEGGASDQYSISSAYPITGPNTITLTLSIPDGSLLVSPNTITFNSSNYSTPQTVTVTAVDDSIIQSSISRSAVIKHTVSGNTNAAGLDFEITANIFDNEQKIIDSFDYVDTAGLLAIWSNGGVSSASLNTGSMQVQFNNTSSISRNAPFANWQSAGIKGLTLYFRGVQSNAANADKLYVQLTDGSSNSHTSSYGGSPAALQSIDWTMWNINLEDFAGIDLANIASIRIGITGTSTDTVYFDNIGIYAPRCLPSLVAGDCTGDCMVNIDDLAVMAENWLKKRGLLAWYKFDEPSGSIAVDSSGNGYNGTIYGEAERVAGQYGTALNFNTSNSPDYVLVQDVLTNIKDQVTVTFWQNGNVDKQPQIDYIFDSYPQDNVFRAHIPHGDSKCYWDAGGTDSSAVFDRVSKAAVASEFEGQWNFWALTKNTVSGDMKMYLNGVLWQSGTGKTLPISVQSLTIGSRNDPQIMGYVYNYAGMIDDFRIYNIELTLDEINKVMLNTLPLNSKFNRPVSTDVDGNGIVNWVDFARLAQLWLESEVLWP